MGELILKQGVVTEVCLC